MIRFAVAIPVDAAIERLTAAALALPTGVVAHINGQANCAKKGIEVPADQILEIFRPDLAVRVWAAEKRAGIEIPIRIHVYAEGETTWVACRLPSDIFAPYGNSALSAVGTDADALFRRILSCLDEAKNDKCN